MTAPLLGLPVELLYRIFLLSSSPKLPLVCQSLWSVFRHAPPSVTAQYLPDNLQSALNYPIMNQGVLEQYFRLHPPDPQARNVKLPLRLFKRLPRPRTKELREQSPDHYQEDSEPIPFLKSLLRLCPDRVDVNFPNEYPLRSAVRAGHLPLVKLLLQAGANPCGGEYDSLPEWSLVVAIKIRSLSLVKMMMEEGPDKREKVPPELPSELLKEAYERRAYDIVLYLTEEKGMVPTVDVLRWVAELMPSRKRRRLDSIDRGGPSE